ncbi:MAG: transglutaminase-like cysteine peptidase [Sphingomicrobium sp.]
MAITFRPSCLRLPLLALVLTVGAAMPASAQWAGGGADAFTKSEAILGGAPSRLAAIMAEQSGMSAPSPALFRSTLSSAGPLPFMHAPFVIERPATPLPAPIPAVSANRPDVFNSVAIEVSHTPLDRRWNGVSHGPVGGAAGAFAASLAGTGEAHRIEAVNAYVNRRVSFVDDSRRFGVADRWSSASETLASGRGDCEDYAIAKMAMLRRAGISEHNLYLVVLNDLVRRADHAVLVVRSEGRFLVLDNGTDQLLDSSEVRDYRPILTFTVGRVFTHGYRRDAAPPVTYASASMATAPAYSSTAPAAAPAFAALDSASLPMSMFSASAPAR